MRHWTGRHLALHRDRPDVRYAMITPLHSCPSLLPAVTSTRQSSPYSRNLLLLLHSCFPSLAWGVGVLTTPVCSCDYSTCGVTIAPRLPPGARPVLTLLHAVGHLQKQADSGLAAAAAIVYMCHAF